MSRKYKFRDPEALYFVSFATVYWIDVFTREEYFQVLARSLSFCRSEKSMEVYAYCFMPSHVHLIFRHRKGDPSGLLRDYKRFTARELLKEILLNQVESRKEWLIRLMRFAASGKSNVSEYQFWQHHNKPIQLWSTSVITQKIDYVHENPVQAGFVTKPEHWKYGSARNYAGLDAVIEIDAVT